MIRTLPWIALALALSGGGWYVRDLSADYDAALRDKATAERALLDHRAIADQATQARDVAKANAKRLEEKLAATQAAFDAYKNGDCDATDPNCAIRFINDSLRNRANGN